MKKRGFIAISLLYSFFLVCVVIMLSLIISYTHNRILIDSTNKNVKEELEEFEEKNKKVFDMDIFAGMNNSFLINMKGNLFGWGDNWYAQIFIGKSTFSELPQLVKIGNKIKMLSAGKNHSLIIDENDDLWVWGVNNYGQLGDGTSGINNNKHTPKQILNETKFATVSAGYEHSLAIDIDGQLWAWGHNLYGKLGDGTETRRSSPKKISTPTKFKSVSAGKNHSLALDEDGNLWGWGENVWGALGFYGGFFSYEKKPRKIITGIIFETVVASKYYDFSFGIDKSNNLWAWGNQLNGQLGNGKKNKEIYTPEQIQTGVSFLKVALGHKHVIALDIEGNLWSWGYNAYGQLGDGTNNERHLPLQITDGIIFTSIAAGEYHNLAIDEEGNVWAWGYNGRDQLGDGTRINWKEPKKINIY